MEQIGKVREQHLGANFCEICCWKDALFPIAQLHFFAVLQKLRFFGGVAGVQTPQVPSAKLKKYKKDLTDLGATWAG